MRAPRTRSVVRVLERQRPLFLALMASSLALGITYLGTAVPTYVATASLVIDRAKTQSVEPSSARAESGGDAAIVETEIEVLKSRTISRSVIETLHLAGDPEFVGGEPRFFETMLASFVTGVASVTKENPARLVLEIFEANRDVVRVGQSHVIEIVVRSVDPEKAAQIANAIAAAYIEDGLEAEFEAMRRASTSLQEHLDAMRAKSAARQLAATNFRETNKITGAGGRLMNEQMSQLNSQLILAQALTAEAKARYDRIRAIMNEEVPDASIADVFKNDIIVRLRAQYLDMAARESIWSQKYGQTHSSVVSQRAQMREIQRSIKDEMRKIEEAYKSDYEISQARELSLAQSLGDAVSRAQTETPAQIELHALEASAETTKSLHGKLLERYMDAVERQSFPISRARLISPAEPPRSRSFPHTSLVLLVTLAGGFVASFCVVLVRDALDKTVRSSDDVEAALGVPCLAVLPRLKAAAADETSARPAEAGERQGPHSRSTPQASSGSRLDHVIAEPFSRFSEALRSVKVACDLAATLQTGKVVGFTSTLPNEGKSTIAANFATLVARGGGRAILIDADLCNPVLSDAWAGGAPGLVDVLAGHKTLEDVLLSDPRSQLMLLASGPKSALPHTHDVLGGDTMRKLVAALRETYDYVIVDLPPLVPVVDARASVPFIDAFIFVVEWGVTRIDAAKDALANAPELAERLLGVVINKADTARLGRYDETYRGRHAGPAMPGSENSRGKSGDG